jgi:L-seryl-tRNA(Ser) seleniumtransferase
MVDKANPGVRSAIKSELYRKLPSVDELIQDAALAALIAQQGRTAVTDAARTVLARIRTEIAVGRLDPAGVGLAVTGLAEAIERQIREALSYSLRPVVNATGVILHTNLGRAPLSESALAHIRKTAGVYCNLEFDLKSAERGKREAHVDRLFQKLFCEEVAGSWPAGQAGAPTEAGQRKSAISTIIVNNNAAAVLLALNTLAEAGEVVVSRGELVEIGGSFRIPEIMAKSGAILREVGTTNRTRIADYERAINEKTKLLLRVHRSNFLITGFTAQPKLDELATLAHKRNIPLMEDLGSGALFDLESAGIQGEPDVFYSLRAGVDVVTYSGDKLLGGPQAGIISGRSDLVARMRANSLFRALRVDKLTYAALEATLLAYVKRDHDAIPALRMMRLSKDTIGERAQSIASQVRRSAPLSIELLDGESVVGGGAAPSAVIPTRLLAISSAKIGADELLKMLRDQHPPIIGRVEEGRVLLDLRTVFPEQDGFVREALARIGRQEWDS